MQGGVRFSKPIINAFVATIDGYLDVDFTKPPVGFKEVEGFMKGSKSASVRYVNGKLYGNSSISPSKVRAKRKGITLESKNKKAIVIAGSDITEIKDVLSLAYKNKWIIAEERDQEPEFRILNGRFNVNRKIDLKNLEDLLRYLPKNTFRDIPFLEEKEIGLRRLKAIVMKFQLGLTLHVFENGTVTFSGLKTLKNLNIPREVFKEIVVDSYDTVFKGSPYYRIPKFVNNPKVRLAGRNPLAANGNWSKVPTYRVPEGYYVRPGTDGLPRLYVYQFYRKLEEGPTIANGPPVNMKAIAPKVIKAFEKVGQPIPASTLAIFRRLGHPLNKEPEENKVKYANTAERRAPSWNAEKPGHYVRPGPGRQPYWAKIPKGIAAGRATVVKRYTEAGRNIPAPVRKIFGIASNVTTAKNTGPVHTIGKNGSINGRQWKRLTKAELIAVARNMGISQVSNSMAPPVIMGYILGKAHPAPVVVKKTVEKKAPESPNSNNFETELEYALRIKQNLGNNYKNGDENKFMKIYRNLPSGARGKPLKATVNKAYSQFIKERALNKFTSKIQVPNWMPKNKVESYKRHVTNLAFKVPKLSNKNFRNGIKAWVNIMVPVNKGSPAREVENVITGEKIKIPARVAPLRTSPVAPKRSPKVRKPRAPKNTTLNYVYKIPTSSANYSNRLEKLGINTARNWTWKEIRAVLKDKLKPSELKKLKTGWNTNVVAKANYTGRATGPIKRKKN